MIDHIIQLKLSLEHYNGGSGRVGDGGGGGGGGGSGDNKQVRLHPRRRSYGQWIPLCFSSIPHCSIACCMQRLLDISGFR
jgi:hypothetical protein